MISDLVFLIFSISFSAISCMTKNYVFNLLIFNKLYSVVFYVIVLLHILSESRVSINKNAVS